MLRKLLCATFGHRFVVLKRFSPRMQMVGCTRCMCSWGMEDETRSFIPWDAELHALHFGREGQ